MDDLTTSLGGMLHLLKVIPETILDGDGIRYSIYLAGCRHACPGCHNPLSWSPQAGEPLTEERIGNIIEEIKGNFLLDGVTFSGGDPFYNPTDFGSLLRRVREETGLSIWCYTGYLYEELLADPERAPLLEWIDVLVDGPFEKRLYDPTLSFRGSSNQRIIHLKAKR